MDCSSPWSEISDIMGPCIRPGGVILTGRALETCGLLPGSRVADIGCGGGGTLEYLEQTGLYRAVGLDYSDTLLGEAYPRLVSPRLVRGRAETLPFKIGSLDALFCECVFSILGDRVAALGEFARALKDGGYLVVSDVFDQGCSTRGQRDRESEGLGEAGLFGKEDLLDPLIGLGFSLLLWEEHGSLLKEFVVRMILAGGRLSDLWGCRQGGEGKKADRSGISYFLLVARKGRTHFNPVETIGDD